MDDREALLTLAHHLGDPSKGLAIAAEGNVSARLGEDAMSIKASGCSMSSMSVQDFVDVRISTLTTLLASTPTDEGTQDDHTRSIYEASKIKSTTRTPSVEAILHATVYESTEATVIAHTHPTAVNALGCSQQSQLLVEGMLFPDAIVLMGSRQLLIPYTDPGIPLARAVRAGVHEFSDSEGTAPRVIYLANHGLFVLATSPSEALQITEMANKNATILLGTLGAGGPNFLSPDHVRRIDSRPDELYRRGKLATDGRGSDG